ncbi:amino acid ABC transporter membrane protein, PAAT family [Halorubrum ezzemoulense]|jgi:polar amino acid transport system permease protein|uniref:Amino acid ABC transporter membrane protein, PAAT family n=4 Tax=Halorubrum TaxID=56688 RepID=A0A238XFG2_HALEZ|nr:amino acid ABC transporter membrane protein, PAAT family [Halorubrum ezzemoulense]
MATQTESESSGGGVLMRDRLVKRVGEVAAGGFVLAIGGLLAWILSTQVDYSLLASPLIARRFAEAFFLVIQIVVISSLLSVSLGVLVGLGRISTSNVTGRIAKGYVEFFRGTPLLFQLFVIYFGVPRLWATGEFPFTDWAIPAAIIGLTLNHGAYVGEAIRGGIDAVPNGQMEAARSLGMSRVMALRQVVLPQAWRNALAAIGNDQIILVKDTSLLTVIAVPEIMSVFRNINSNQLDPWTPLVWVCVLYLAITMSMSQLVNGLERRSDWGSDSRMFGRLSGLGSGDDDGGEEA